MYSVNPSREVVLLAVLKENFHRILVNLVVSLKTLAVVQDEVMAHR